MCLYLFSRSIADRIILNYRVFFRKKQLEISNSNESVILMVFFTLIVRFLHVGLIG